MNHDPAPEVTATGWRGLLQRFARWRHFREWEYGSVPDMATRARRSRSTGAVQFVLWPADHKTQISPGVTYTYPADWWHDMDQHWWNRFRPHQKSQGAPR